MVLCGKQVTIVSLISGNCQPNMKSVSDRLHLSMCWMRFAGLDGFLHYFIFSLLIIGGTLSMWAYLGLMWNLHKAKWFYMKCICGLYPLFNYFTDLQLRFSLLSAILIPESFLESFLQACHHKIQLPIRPKGRSLDVGSNIK